MVQNTDLAATTGENLVAIALAGEAALSLCAFNPATGGLEEVDRIALPGATGICRGVPMVVGVGGTRLYIAWRGEAFRLYSVALEPVTRQLSCLGSTELPASMCYLGLSPDGRQVLSASNAGSVISVSPIDETGCARGLTLTQEAFKAHCIETSRAGMAYVTSLRGDCVQCYRIGSEGDTLELLSRLDLPAGSGPRHIRLSADGARAYLLSEFQGLVSVLDVDPDSGRLSMRQSLKLLPGQERVKAAELRLGADETLLYASERNSSQIFTYLLDASGEMQPLGAIPAPQCPTAFTLTACGRHLIALGEQSGEAWSYQIGRDGRPEYLNRVNIGAVPSWVVAL
jgi:6-phosphogluconolactonase